MIDLFLIDPPWDKRKGGKRKIRPNQDKQLDYNTLGTSAIFNLLDKEVFNQAAETHTVFMWMIDEFLHAAEREMDDRGYKRHARLIWDKENGIAPAFSVRYTHEYLVWYYKPKFTGVAEDQRGRFSTVIREPAREHSRKPEAAYIMLDVMFPGLKKMDVFSRLPRAGWEQFGDQQDHFEGGVPWLFS